MAEAGGTSTQAGIFYQNSVAALALAELLELAPMPPSERVVEVRIEAPSDVDDIVVRYADGHRDFKNVKSSLTVGSAAWADLWKSLSAQSNAEGFGPEDVLTVVLAESTPLARILRELCERAATSPDATEWHSRIAASHEEVLSQIAGSLGESTNAFELLRRVTVRVTTEHQIEGEFDRRRLGGRFATPAAMLRVLRDISGGGARRRALHLAAPLRQLLARDHGIDVAEPPEWGLPAYRASVAQLARVQIPGTGISGPAEELFVWPRVRRHEPRGPSGFEDEHAGNVPVEFAEGVIDMRVFPSDQLDRCVVVAGPGYGKSALLSAIGGRLSKGPVVPVLIPLASMAAASMGVREFLDVQVNRDFDVKVDWQRLAEQGSLALLLDGLDEVPAGARPSLLDRIAKFSARYPSVPWLLTVRDPSVIAGPIDATVLEILPLNDEDVVRFIDTMKLRLPAADAYHFLSKLRLYPDLLQLARIPLFLSILLATIGDLEASLPSSRSDVIEAYLTTLFYPQAHKSILAPEDHAIQLRRIAETIAFERLERQEVGASEQVVREAVSHLAEGPTAATSLFEQLQSNGVMRKQSGIRLQFPYPIVQEYLAACHLVRHLPDSLSARIDDAIQRPWAQVIQFAIEKHPDPTPVVKAMLERPDDAFCTGLRLIGRCIANGAQVDESLRQEVGNRLVGFWIGAPSGARERVGRIIADGFASPMSSALRAAVHHRWVLHDGGGEIISKAKDRALTMSVLNAIMDSKLDYLARYLSLDPAFVDAGDEAFVAILDRLKTLDPSSDQYRGVASLVSHFAPGTVSRNLALSAAVDPALPRELRLHAFLIAGDSFDDDCLKLISDVLEEEESSGLCIALRALAQHPSRDALLNRFLRDDTVPMSRRRTVAGYTSEAFADEASRTRFIQEILEDSDIDPTIADTFRLFAARYGDKATFEALVARIADGSSELAARTVSLFGHHPERVLGETAAELAKTRGWTGADAVRVGSAAATGMLYVFEMDWGFGGVLRYATPHSATPRWMSLVEEWCDLADLTFLQRLQLLTAASQLGSASSRARLHAAIQSLDPDTVPLDGHHDDNVLSNAIHEVRRKGAHLPIELGERWTRSTMMNISSVGVSVIESHGTAMALRTLVRLHSQAKDWMLRDRLEGAIESLAAKLGAVVSRDGSTLRLT